MDYPSLSPKKVEAVNKAIADAVKSIAAQTQQYIDGHGTQEVAERMVSDRVLASIYWTCVKIGNTHGLTVSDEGAEESILTGVFRSIFGADNFKSVILRLMAVIEYNPKLIRETYKRAAGTENASEAVSYALTFCWLDNLDPLIDKMISEAKTEMVDREARAFCEKTPKAGAHQKTWSAAPILASDTVQSFTEYGYGVFFAGTEQNGVFRSTGGLQEWEQSSVGAGENIIDLVTDEDGSTYAVSHDRGIFRCVDMESWEHIGAQRETTRCMLVVSTGELILGSATTGICEGTIRNESIVISQRSWQGEWITCLHRGRGDTLYAGTLGGSVLRRSDSERDWVLVQGFPVTKDMITAVTSNLDGEVFVGTGEHGVLKFADPKWVPLNEGLRTKHIQSLACSTEGDLLAGTQDGGVFFSRNNGLSWDEHNFGLGSPNVQVVSFTTAGSAIAGTMKGLYYLA